MESDSPESGSLLSGQMCILFNALCSLEAGLKG